MSQDELSREQKAILALLDKEQLTQEERNVIKESIEIGYECEQQCDEAIELSKQIMKRNEALSEFVRQIAQHAHNHEFCSKKTLHEWLDHILEICKSCEPLSLREKSG
jgi:hypothetical protein